jgi:hypothetical protein
MTNSTGLVGSQPAAIARPKKNCANTTEANATAANFESRLFFIFIPLIQADINGLNRLKTIDIR